jgi:sec-independent protein translocase protein TatB
MDNILGIGLPELIFIAILALIFLGPERLPGTLRQIARAWGYARNLGRELTAQFSEEFKDLEDLNPRKLLNDLADEELAKDLKSLNANSKKSAATTKAAATTTKPGSSPTAKTTAGPTARPSAAATKVTKPVAAKTSEGQSANGASVPPLSETAATADLSADGELSIAPSTAQRPASTTPADTAKATELASAG